MDKLWKWVEMTPGPTDASSLKEQKFSEENYITYVVREAVQNSVDAWKKSIGPADEESIPAIIKFDFRSSDQNLEKYYSGLIDARKLLDESNEHGSKYSDQISYKQSHWFSILDLNTGGIQGDLNDRDSDYWNFNLNWGKSNKGKDNQATGGSKGVGRITFPMSSEIKAVFNITKRKDQTATAGFALLDSGIDSEGVRRVPHAIFADEEIKEKCVWKLHDISKDFIQDFNLQELNAHETGTAIVIPFPREEISADIESSCNKIKASLIENYAPLIIRGNLKPVVGDEEINSTNINQIAKEIQEDFSLKEFKSVGTDFIKFCEDSIYQLETNEEYIEIELDKWCNLEDWIMSEEMKVSINERLSNNEVVTFKINFPIVQKGKENKTFIEISFKQPELKDNGSKRDGLEAYYRNGLFMRDIPKRVAPEMHAALFTRDDTVGLYLGVFENSEHTKWLQGGVYLNHALDKGYDKQTYVRPVKLCVNAISNLHRKFADENQIIDEQVWSSFFKMAIQEEKKHEKDEDENSVEESEVDEIIRNLVSWNFSGREGGFSLKHKKDSKIPKKEIFIHGQFRSEKTLTRVSYLPHDFNFADALYEAKNCSVTAHNDTIKIDNIKDGFSLKVSGLDATREYELNIRTVK
ncbi:hypothetical protein N9450_04590 [Gammaproteobacteria bacterium]|nr:hypothetical protein [Gammaproteobacteria bacterium]